jgi:hypothetical protein
VSPLPADERPFDRTPIHTEDLPATPTREYSIPGAAWIEAPSSLLALAEARRDGIEARYLRRIGPWLLWRVGPARGEHADYWAALADDLSVVSTLHLLPDGSADGTGPSGDHHTRFRTWKEDLRDHPTGA